MKRLALIGCSARKLSRAAPAKELYTGALFRKSVAYAERACDAVAILSAKHHFLRPETVVAPYDLSLNKLSRDERRAWGQRVEFQMRVCNCIYPSEWRLVFLAGSLYVSAVAESPGFRGFGFEQPLFAMQIGQAMRWLDQQR